MNRTKETHDEIEKSFHDSLAGKIVSSPEKVDTWETENWNFILDNIGDLKNKRILDVGCGFGRDSILFAKNGAIVTGIDISDKSIELAQKSAINHNVNVNFKVLKVEDLDYEHHFDVIYCKGSLHHFYDVEKVISILYNCLKEGGLLIAQEPKAENPIAVIGRMFFNPSTSTERPFKTGELNHLFTKVFGNCNAKYFNLFSPICFTFAKIRFLNSGFLRNIVFNLIAPIDRVLLKYNFFKKYSWIEVVWSYK